MKFTISCQATHLDLKMANLMNLLSRFLKDVKDSDLEIKLSNGKKLFLKSNEINNAFGQSHTSISVCDEDDALVVVYKRTCHFCHNGINKSQHCKGDMNWQFCNSCYTGDATKRRTMYEMEGVVKPFSLTKCKQKNGNCQFCKEYKKWQENRRVNDDEENEDEESDDDTITIEEDSLESEYDSEIGENDSEDAEIINPHKRRRRLIRRDDDSE